MRSSPASSLDDLERPVSEWVNLATEETQAPAPDQTGLDEDGKTWLDTRLSVADLLVVADSTRLTPQDRVRIAVAARLRADFSGQPGQAQRAAQLAGELLPRLKPLAERYRQAASATRHCVLLVAGPSIQLDAQRPPGVETRFTHPKPDTRDRQQLGRTATLLSKVCVDGDGRGGRELRHAEERLTAA